MGGMMTNSPDPFPKTGIVLFEEEDFEDLNRPNERPVYSPDPNKRTKSPLIAAYREVIDNMSRGRKVTTIIMVLVWQALVYILAGWKLMELAGLL